MACDGKVGFGDETYDLVFGSGDEMKDLGVGSGEDVNDRGLSSPCSSFLLELISALFASDDARVCDFREGQGSGIVIVKLCL